MMEIFATAIPIPTDNASIEVAIARNNNASPLVMSLGLHCSSLFESLSILRPIQIRTTEAIHSS